MPAAPPGAHTYWPGQPQQQPKQQAQLPHISQPQFQHPQQQQQQQQQAMPQQQPGILVLPALLEGLSRT